MGGNKVELFKLEHFGFSYAGSDKKALDDISLTVTDGEFILVCGQSGSGKSTLLSCLKGCAGAGEQSGEIYAFGEKQREDFLYPDKIGFVSQLPDEQTVTDKVWHELAFGAESLGLPQSVIRSRIAQTALFFGIEQLFDRKTNELSGGQKQMINLASVMVMQPRVLLLDEPVSQLDPIAAAEFIGLLVRINKELGTAIIIAEHNLPALMPVCGRMIVTDKGKIIADDLPHNIPALLREKNHLMLSSMPAGVRACAAVGESVCPLSVNEARIWYNDYVQNHTIYRMSEDKAENEQAEICVKLRDVCFRFEKNGENIINNLSLDIYKYEVLCILGGNAAGKTTLLKLVCGILTPQSGSILFPDFKGESIKGKIGYLPQNPSALFSKSTVYEDILSVCGENRNIDEIISLCRLESLTDRHPYDLSGGERQRAALAKLLARGFDILVLDEPSKGLDNDYKALLSAIIRYLRENGKTIIIVSHDADFCAENADRCAMLFGGEITVSCAPREFFTENFFFTTDASKIAKDTEEGVYTTPQLIYSCCKQEPPKVEINIDTDSDTSGDAIKIPSQKKSGGKKQMSPIRKICTITGAVLAAVLMLINSGLFPSVLPSEPFFLPYLFLLAPIILLIIGIAPKNRITASPPKKRKTAADIIASVISIIVIPLTAVCGVLFFDNRKYLFISLIILAECLIPFILLFEHKKPAAKDVAVLALMCAAAVAARELFFMFPQFKPTAVIVIVAGAAFGAQSGFLTGAVSMLVSNMMFGQGTWTPWQMLAMGLVGFFAGLIFSRRRSAVALCIYGFFSVVVLYGGIMNISSVLIYQSNVTIGHILSYIASGLPFDLIHGTATVVFLLLGGTQILEKCERAKVKFGLFQ